MIPRSPYQDLPAAAFWRSAVRDQEAQTLDALHVPKFAITPETRLMTAGSCFAQHIHRTLAGAGWAVLDEEPMADLLPERLCRRWGYGLFSARYGNIYTARQLRELVEEALGARDPAPIVWRRGDRFVDALRPGVEPEGLARPEDVARARAEHLAAVRRALHQAEVIVFTLGLTEAWQDVATGRTLPTAPGTVAGDWDPAAVRFHAFSYGEVLADLLGLRDTLRRHGLGARVLLTVSPVPLTATASGRHVGPASTLSKAVLRAVAGHLHDTDADFDYFPSYEIVATPVIGGPYYAANLRDPSTEGVEAVLAVFSMAYGTGGGTAAPIPRGAPATGDVQCEEILLEAFRP